MLNKRLQVLIDSDRYERLRGESRRQGAPVGELVRRAIDREYPPRDQGLTAAEAAARLLSWELPAGDEPDWEGQKERMLDELGAAATKG